MIVHPDYLAFNEQPSSTEYSLSLYQDFLEHVRDRYKDTAWFARPCDVEQYVRHRLPPEGALNGQSSRFKVFRNSAVRKG